MTLFHSLVAQLRGDPSSVIEQMGGEILAKVPEAHPLGWFALARAGVVMMAEMRKAVQNGPAWFADMKAMASEHRADRLRTVSGEDIVLRLDAIGQWLDEHELTFAIAGGVSQCLQALGGLLPRWLGEDWRALLNGALQGQAAAISAQQIVRLAEVADMVRRDPKATSWFTAEGWNPVDVRRRLEGTDVSVPLTGISTTMAIAGSVSRTSCRLIFADRPELLPTVLRIQILAPTSATPADILSAPNSGAGNGRCREIRTRFGWRFHRWAIFSGGIDGLR
jgi:pyruvate,water dikinase